MKHVELLSPAGNYTSLIYAVNNGADAVYIGGKKYGARAYSLNFDQNEIVKAVKYCHLYGVKLYVTINTVIFDNEVEEFLEYVKFLYENNIDAVIMQDIGMIKCVREHFPNLEIHASTQLHNNNIEQVKLLKKLGVKRVVFARELSIEEISKMDVPIEKEVFIHGALCICYSGCCLFSSLTASRSGNRGECVASCRLPYRLLENGNEVKTNGKYLLSTKELNTINNIGILLDNNIDSLKIEGRMKSPEYVGFITSMYRKAIDSYYSGNNYKISKDDLYKMMVLYNREYTNGHLFGDSGKDLMNINTSNHQGTYLGKVIEVDSKKIKILLDEDLNQEDGIRFVSEEKGMIVNKLYNTKDLLVNSIKKGNIAVVDNKIGLTKKDIVNKTIDKLLMNELSILKERKVKIDMKVTALVNKPLEITIKDVDGNIVNLEGESVSKSINRPLSKEDIEKQVTKLGNTPFIIDRLDIVMDDNIFIPNKFLNELRREVCDRLIYIRENSASKKENFKLHLEDRTIKKDNRYLNVLVRNEEQLKAALSLNVDNIYITDYSLYKEYKNSNIYFVLPRVINHYADYKDENLLVRELGSINKYVGNKLIGDYTLNICNYESINTVSSLGLDRVCLSVEVDLDNLKRTNYNTEIIVYGRIELMITKYCIMNMVINNDDKKCSLCQTNKYTLVSQNNNKYPIGREGHLMVIYSDNIDLSDKIDIIKEKVNNIRINLYDEDYNETINLINRFRRLYDRRD